MYTFNWDAVYSTDGGQTFKEIDPHTTFPPDDGGFGCDQVVQYDPTTRIFIWALQYHCAGDGVNLIRIAWATASNLERYGAGAWSWADLNPVAIAGKDNTYLDQPRLAFTDRFLYISLRQGALKLDKSGTPIGGTLEHTAIVRIPRASFASTSGSSTSLPYGWALLDPISLRVAQNVQGSREFFVGHNGNSKLTVGWVDDSSNLIQLQDIDSPTIATDDWTTNTPGGDNMLDHLSIGQQTAVTGVTQGGDGTLWAAWSEGRKLPSGTSQYAQPHVGVAELQPIPGHTGFTLRAQHEYVSPSYSYALPDLATDASGQVAFDVVWGGGQYFANHAVGFLYPRDQRSNAFQPVADQLGTSDSPFKGNPFGDFETVRPIAPPYGNCLAAAGIVNRKDSSGTEIGFPVFTIFSRPGVTCPPSFKILPVVPLPPVNQPPAPPPPPPTTPPLQPTSLTLTCPSSVNQDTTFQISGLLSPAIQGAPITLTYAGSGSGSQPITHAVVTDPSGAFSDTAPGEPPGTVTIDAHYGGNSTAGPSDRTCTATVHPVIP